MQIRKLSNRYHAPQEERLAQRQDFFNIITGLGFSVGIPESQQGVMWPSVLIVEGTQVYLNDDHDKVTLSNTRWKSKGDGSMSVNLKIGELVSNPKRLKNRLGEIIKKCAEQDTVERDRKQKLREAQEYVEQVDTWLKGKFNPRCKAERYDNDTVEMDIRNGEDGTRMFQIRYNYKTSEYTVQKYCIRTMNNYDWFNQTRIQELKNEIEEYEQALTQAQSIITQMNLEKIV
jgi:hypothetical protein